MTKDYSIQVNARLIVKEISKIHQIPINEIVFIHSESGISTIYKSDNSKVIVSKNLAFFQKNLCAYAFKKANRNKLINCAYVLFIDTKNRQLRLLDCIIDISCRNIKNFTNI